MDTPKKRTPDDIVELRAANVKMRERDFGRIHGISEAELIAAHVGQNVTRLNVDVEKLLARLPAFGEVMALTRNESAVHEKIGPYEGAHFGKHASIVLGEQIDLRIFPSKWMHGFAVIKENEDGSVRRSLQFFDAAGDAVHKIHVRPATDLSAYEALVEELTSADQSREITTSAVANFSAIEKDAPQATVEELREKWSKLTDTHQFVGMLKRLNLTRHQAMHMVGHDYAWPVDADAVLTMMEGAAAIELPIMVFVGSAGCIQIHSGPIENVKTMGPWVNIMDETFHLHLRNDHINELWAVQKPTSDGHVTSVEAYDASGEIIIQFFGKRLEGHDERPEWRELVKNLPLLEKTNAA